MKKFSYVLFLLSFLIVLLVSCAESPDGEKENAGAADFSSDFTYSISDPEYVENDRFFIIVTLTNTSGKDYDYYGTANDLSLFSARLYQQTNIGTYELNHDPMPSTDDLPHDRVFKANSEVKSYFYFDVPEDVALGEYTFEFSGYDNNTYSKKITINERPQSTLNVPESEKYTVTLIVSEADEGSFLGIDYDSYYPSEMIVANWFYGKHELKAGDTVHVICDGLILETAPAQFSEIYEMQLVLEDGSIFSVTEDDLPEKEPFQLGENETLENNMILSYTSEHKFESDIFLYEITDFKSVTNDYFEFAITITNISGEDYEYFGTYNDERVTEARVYTEFDGGEYHFTHEEIALTDDEAANHTIKAGEGTKSYFRFDLPSTTQELDKIPLFADSFSVEFTHLGKTVIIEDALCFMSMISVDLTQNSD